MKICIFLIIAILKRFKGLQMLARGFRDWI